MPINVAIAGATGHLGTFFDLSLTYIERHVLNFPTGPNVVRAFLDPSVHPSQVHRVVIFTRTATSATAQDLKARGAEVIEGAPTVEGFNGIDVFVNVLSDRVPPDARDTYIRAAIEAGVKVYFPNDFVAYVAPVDLSSSGIHVTPSTAILAASTFNIPFTI